MAGASKTFRVFVSSTFSDMKAERNALQERVFPKLRELCSQRGCRFQAIDLRWGVSQEAALDQQAMPICLQEIRRCQDVTPRPNFIVLLGQRYGWRPLPAAIPADEFEAILEHLSDDERDLLLWQDDQPDDRTGWYRRDDNAVPPEFVLQPREHAGPYEDAAAWAPVEARLRAILLAAIAKLDLPEADRIKHERSATEQEIIEGALQAGTDHAFCYFRTIDDLPDGEGAGDSVDLDQEGNADADACARRQALTAQLRDHFPGEHVHDYTVAWAGNGVAADQLQPLCDRIEADLTRIILEEIDKLEAGSELDAEQQAHEELAKERSAHFRGREDVLKRIEDYGAGDSPHPLVVHGSSGSGKTAVLAHSWLALRDAQPGVAFVARFIGVTPGASDLRGLLTSLCQELGIEQTPTDLNELVSAFRDRLSPGDKEEGAPPQEGRVVIFLDALDQISDTDNARMLYWLPRELAPNVKLVLSVLDEKGEAGECFDIAKRIWPDALVEVGALGGDDAEALLDTWLEEAGRTLQPDQRGDVLAKFAGCPKPLYLRLAFQEARRWRSWDGLPCGADDVPGLNADVPGILDDLFWRLELPRHHGQMLASRALGYLGAGKNGLTEDELLDVLSADADVMASFQQRSPDSPEVDRLPVVVWSRLFADVEPYMTRRRADGTVVLSFYHRQVGESVASRYLPDDERLRAHLHLADYFADQDYWAESLEAQRARARRLPPTPRPANIRKVVELPHHRLEAAKLGGVDDPKSPLWDAVADLLMDWQFLEAKAEADPTGKYAAEQAAAGTEGTEG